MQKTLILITIAIVLCFLLPTEIKELQYKKLVKELEQNHFELPQATSEEYLGTITIESVNIKNIIKKGTTKEILDNWYVGLLEPATTLENNTKIVLAGHNIKEVFQRLHQVKIQDEIKIQTQSQTKMYQVTEIKDVKPYETECLETNEPNILILITCTDHDKKRKIIYAKQI